ncbi:MAG: A/G-specific adenine glycosylase [Planctomycetaceae bacterium]
MSAFPKLTDLGWRRRLRSRILGWYDRHGRQLPWRASSDPYRIWISEIMLQQTTVAAVLPYFERFLSQFPDVQTLAAAEQSDVLRAWEGLGYYSRARNLHKAAQTIVNDCDGRFPESAEQLQQLPGIGPYTAGAIASFAFQQPAAILEANTLRLFSRLIALEIDPRGTEGQKTLWKFAGWAVSRKRPADFNQAVMDIGSQICRPVDPECNTCPLLASCKARENNRQNDIPVAAQKVVMTDLIEVAVAVRRSGRYLLRQRTEAERWAGLWDFPRFEITEAEAEALPRIQKQRSGTARHSGQRSLFDMETDDSPEPTAWPLSLQDRFRDITGLNPVDAAPVQEIRHTVTRYRIRLLCFQATADSGRILAGSGFQWFRADDLHDLPLSKTGRQLAETLLTQQASRKPSKRSRP